MADKNGKGSIGNLADMVSDLTNEGKKKKERAARARRDAGTKAGLLTPWFLFAFANLVLAFGEYRVYEYVRALTGSWVLAVGTLLATGVGAEMFFFGWKYTLARKFQQWISIIMMVINFSIATYIGFGDYVRSADGLSFGATQQTVFVLLAGALALDVVAALAYFISDPQVKQQRIDTQTRLQLAQRKTMFKFAEQMLEDSREMLSVHKALTDEFGEDAVEGMLTLFNDGKGEDDKIANKLASSRQQPTRPESRPVQQMPKKLPGGNHSRPVDDDLEAEHNFELEPVPMMLDPKATG